MRNFKINNEDVYLDPDILRFNQENINEFLAEFAAKYDHFQNLHSMAEAHLNQLKADYENEYATKFVYYKEVKSSDKLAEAQATAHPEVKAIHDQMLTVQHTAKTLYGWLRSMDKAYESSKEYCYNLRKEIDKFANPYVKKFESM